MTSRGLIQAYRTQDLAYQAILDFRQQHPTLDDSNASALAALIHAWVETQERIRIHRRVPLPGTARPKSKAKRVRTLIEQGSMTSSPVFAAPEPEQVLQEEAPELDETDG